MAAFESDFANVMGWCVGLLALKAIILSLATVRIRLASDCWFLMAPEDDNRAERLLLAYVVKPLVLLAPGQPKQVAFTEVASEREPLLQDIARRQSQEVVRWQRLHTNAVEQEPFVVAAAFAYAFSAGLPHASASWLISAYTAFRYLHMLAYICKLQPWRTLLWTAGSLCGLGLIILVFLHA